MPFGKWRCHLEVGEIVLQHIQAPPDLFFIHWYLMVSEGGIRQ
jgi:hypothetical protein